MAKRTPEQLKNLRNVFILTFGPFAMLMNDDAVNMYANRLQEEVDKASGIQTWSLRVRMQENKDASWEDIDDEPTFPKGTSDQIKASCKKLLAKYPSIVAIQVRDYCGNPRFDIDRSKNESN